VVLKKCLPQPDPDAFPDDLFPDLTPFCHPVKDNSGITTHLPSRSEERTAGGLLHGWWVRRFILFACTSSEECVELVGHEVTAL
jgi:hypothetical protein